MSLGTFALSLLLSACGSSAPEEAPEAPEAAAAKTPPAAPAGEAKAKARPKPNRPPVERVARFEIPLGAYGVDDIAALQDAVEAAWREALPEAEIPADSEPNAWKCRRGTTWAVEGAEAEFTVFERHADPDCAGEVETWDVAWTTHTDAPPTTREGGGALRFLLAGNAQVWDGGDWAEDHYTIHRLDGGRSGGAFPHDDAWLASQAPDGVTVGKKAVFDSRRWNLAKVDFGEEKVIVEAEHWTCDGSDTFVAGALVFRTNQRGDDGHARATEAFEAFAAALVEALGDKIGDKTTSPRHALSCAG